MIIESIEKIPYEGDTYNLHIEDNHNYFAENILVSNCHLAKADTLQRILSNPFETRIGLTGTMPIEMLDALLLEQQFGMPETYITAKGLIDLGLATDLTIVPIFLNQKVKLLRYQDEVKYRETDTKRIKFVSSFLKKLTGLTIVLYQHTQHGKDTWADYTKRPISDITGKDAFDKMKDSKCFFLSGGTKPIIRKKILEFLSTETGDYVLVGQSKILSTGINIKPLRNLVFLSSNKSYTQVIQSIGRVLRLHESKNKALVFDLVDDYTQGRKTENYALKHFYQRSKYYENQGFNIIEKEVTLD